MCIDTLRYDTLSVKYRSEGRSSRGILSPGGGADQDPVFPCRAVSCRVVACRRQISKNPQKVKKYLTRFELVEAKLKDVEERDQIRNWQPPVSGETIMKTFGIKPSREVGIIKDSIKEAILDGMILNNETEVEQFMLAKGKELGLRAV